MTFLELENKTGIKLPIIDINNGILTVGDNKLKVTALLLDRKLTEDEQKKILKYKSVVKIGEAAYRYAPELIHHVIFMKRR